MREGQVVEAGQPLGLLEAMKMEIRFDAPARAVTPGQIVSIDYAVTDNSGQVTNLIFGFTDAIDGVTVSGVVTMTLTSSRRDGIVRL